MEGLTERDLVLQDVFLPQVVHHGGTVLGAEGAHIAEEGGTEETIAQQSDALLLQVLKLYGPSAHTVNSLTCYTHTSIVRPISDSLILFQVHVIVSNP